MGRGSIHHIGFSVRDVGRAEAEFYGPVLGFLGYEKVGGGPDHIAFWRDPKGGPTLHLVAAESGIEPPPSDHCAFSVGSRETVERLHEVLVSHEIKVLSRPADYPNFGPSHYAIFFQDTDGRLFEVMHRPSRADAPAGATRNGQAAA